MLDDQIIRLFGDQISALGTKIDAYHAEIKTELATVRADQEQLEEQVTEEQRRNDRQDVQHKVLRVWGLVALFAGGAGGTVVSNLLS
jgi:hypothetical protein